jgi:hypothetical protein
LLIRCSVRKFQFAEACNTPRALPYQVNFPWDRQVPAMPNRELLVTEARNMFPKTHSLDDIVDVAYLLFVEAGALSWSTVMDRQPCDLVENLPQGETAGSITRGKLSAPTTETA